MKKSLNDPSLSQKDIKKLLKEQEKEAERKRQEEAAREAPLIEPFLAELKELYLRHGIAVSGCGCCGSPFLSRLTVPINEENVENHIQYLRETGL